MQRTNIFLTEEQQRRLRYRAHQEGVSRSRLIRQILDEALEIAPAPISASDAIRATNGIWADREESDISQVLAWRSEASLDRLSR